jgi:hypothetical protein
VWNSKKKRGPARLSIKTAWAGLRRKEKEERKSIKGGKWKKNC